MVKDQGLYSSSQIIQMLDGRLSYRMLDFHIRTGAIFIVNDSKGSGDHRRFTEPEFLAICDFVEAIENSRRLDDEIRSGQLFDEALQRHKAFRATGQTRT